MRLPVEDIGAPEEPKEPTRVTPMSRGEGGNQHSLMHHIRRWIRVARQRQRSLLVGSTIIVVLGGATAAVSAGGSILFARLLGPHEFGLLVLYTTGVATTSLFADVLGFRFANAYSLASSQSAVPLPRVRGTALFYAFIVGLAVGGVVILSPVWGIVFPPYADPGWKLLVLLGLLGQVLLAQIQAVQQGLRAFLSLGFLTLLQVTVYVSLGVVAGGFLGLRLAQDMALMQAISLLLTSLVYIVRFWRQGLGRPSLTYLRQGADVGARAATVNWLSFLHTRIDQYLVMRLLGPAALGVYGVAVSAGDFLTRVPGMVSRVLSPTVAASPDVGKSAESTLRLVLGTMALIAAVSLPLALFAPQIIGLLYGPAFVESAAVFRLYLPAVVFLSGILLANSFMVGTGYPPFLLATLGVVLTANVGLNWFLLRRWGVQGAALTSTLTYGLQVLILILYLARARRGTRRLSGSAARGQAEQAAESAPAERQTASAARGKARFRATASASGSFAAASRIMERRPRPSRWKRPAAHALARGDRILGWVAWLLTRAGIGLGVPKQLPPQQVLLPEGEDAGTALRGALSERLLSLGTEAEPLAGALDSLEPGVTRRILDEADAACAHVFDLLGSGRVQLGDPIDWHAGLKGGPGWDPQAYYRRIRPAAFPGGPDIKEAWELSRCHHFVRLGQAYRLTGDEKYAREFVAQAESWIDSNPWPCGVNWASSMDAAIRAANLLWGASLCQDSAALGDDFLQRLSLSLWIHGRHIRRNLEGARHDPHTGNHYLANLAGLIYIGLCCPFLRDAPGWLDFAVPEFCSEILAQTYIDGADYEGSVYYHRFVLEMALHVTALFRKNGVELPDGVRTRLERMVDFLLALTRPDGTFPLIGDHDNGRLHRFSVWGDPELEWVDAREHLALGAVLLERQDLAEAAGERWQEALWLFGADCLRMREAAPSAPRPANSVAFPSAGVYVIRDTTSHMLIDAGPNGKNGRGGHAHGDTLGFELFVLGRPWIIDPGCYVYTADYAARNLFRSTAVHNAVMVDGLEIHPFDPKHLFLLRDAGQVMFRSWTVTGGEVVLDAGHTCYARLSPPVYHRRMVLHQSDSLVWSIQDTLEAERRRCNSLCLHFAPGLEVGEVSGGTVATDPATGARMMASFAVVGEAELKLELGKGWVSRSYGRRVQTTRVIVSWEAIGDSMLTAVYQVFPRDQHGVPRAAELPGSGG